MMIVAPSVYVPGASQNFCPGCIPAICVSRLPAAGSSAVHVPPPPPPPVSPSSLVLSALGISQQTVSKKLRGETAILLSDLERIAKKFKLPVTWFFEGYKRKDLPSDKVA
jgi:hypothetical protein